MLAIIIISSNVILEHISFFNTQNSKKYFLPFYEYLIADTNEKKCWYSDLKKGDNTETEDILQCSKPE